MIDGNKFSKDFEKLRSIGCQEIYKNFEQVLYYFLKDSCVTCAKFRLVLESFIREIYKTLKVKPTRNLFDDINNLENNLPSQFYRKRIINYMHLMRTIGNKYVHGGYGNRNPEKDRDKLLFCSQEILSWFLTFRQEYQAAESETQTESIQYKHAERVPDDNSSNTQEEDGGILSKENKDKLFKLIKWTIISMAPFSSLFFLGYSVFQKRQKGDEWIEFRKDE